jgi:hypothetical protein
MWVLEYIPQWLCSTMTATLHLQGECQLYIFIGRTISSVPNGRNNTQIKELKVTLVIIKKKDWE